MRGRPDKVGSELQTTGWVDVVGRFVAEHRPLMVRLGDLETRFLADRLEGVSVRSPVYIAGIARCGSTLLLEILNTVPGVVTHQYQDYPFLYTPYWWHTYLRLVPAKKVEPRERAHKDRILVTPQSPEAMEEVLWMTFFPQLHDDRHDQVLKRETTNPRFEAFYRDHIRKLLLVRRGNRYASKGNYNLTRLAYLHRLFPDARFVVPVRAPRDHIASLIKQHRLFSEGERANPKALAHMQRVGHFEFGLDRRVVHVGDAAVAHRIRAAWDAGRDVEGYALLWRSVYGFIHRQLETDPVLREHTLVLRYEDLCEEPERLLNELLAHTGLSHARDTVLRRFADAITPPRYYQAGFTAHEEALIDEITAPTAALFGYNRP